MRNKRYVGYYIILMGGTVVLYYYTFQYTVVKSSTEAEYISVVMYGDK